MASAKLLGLSKIKKRLYGITRNEFEIKAKSLHDSMQVGSNLVSDLMISKLLNKNISDGDTTYPHYRSGNLARNLIDIEIESFNKSRITESRTEIKYSFYIISRLDGGELESTVTSSDGFDYASYLDSNKGTRNTKYFGYFRRLQDIFKSEFRRLLAKSF